MASDNGAAGGRRSRTIPILISVASVLAVASAVMVALLLVAPADASDPVAVPSSAATPEPTTDAAPSEPSPSAATDPRALVPDTCEGIYTRDWATELDPLVLNPAWAAPEGLRGSKDPVLTGLLDRGTTELICTWGFPTHPGHFGITTEIATVGEALAEESVVAAAGQGYDCYDELTGTRCIIQWEHSEGDGRGGESHFLRDGLWSATSWVNVPADGYTHDIVAAIWG
ncbi:hypothetical protein ARHIZOSPH14_21760 [Agromyces rhizosphaerae]|uniref:DUF3558 domain-containing protein n=1 Tax=Agromyces rhizosphaerae TaxID=88374 RepID=A0A9W6CW81_9MICO|nr:hypothetical protein [Agromyces rhizosphaerae]GLI27934.1 hypothetical protein ARHIZOSPH14_21760 [Agromyces rhizosphaerae]